MNPIPSTAMAPIPYATERQRSRRDLLRWSAATASAVALTSALPRLAADELATKSDQDIIDAHVHVWTPDTAHYPLAAGFRAEEMQPPSFTPEQLWQHAQPCGVARVVLIQMSFYGFDNSYMLDTIKQFPDQFRGVAVIDDHAAQPQDEMRRLAKLGVRGFRIYPRTQDLPHWLDGDSMAAMWKCGADDHLAMCHLVNTDALPAIDKMCQRFPDTPVVIDHFGRIGVDGQVRPADVDQLTKLARHKRVKVKISALYALGKKETPYTDLAPMTRRLLDAFGPERLMWASDCPFQVQHGHTYRDSLDLVARRLDFLSDADRQWLLRKTAEQTFFM